MCGLLLLLPAEFFFLNCKGSVAALAHCEMLVGYSHSNQVKSWIEPRLRHISF
jgi:hypothetical protein